MKKIIPQNDNVLCTLETNDSKMTNSGFIYKSNDIPLYKVISISKNAKISFSLSVGDVIRTNSTGTSINIDGVDYVLFKAENIIGKIA